MAELGFKPWSAQPQVTVGFGPSMHSPTLPTLPSQSQALVVPVTDFYFIATVEKRTSSEQSWEINMLWQLSSKNLLWPPQLIAKALTYLLQSSFPPHPTPRPSAPNPAQYQLLYLWGLMWADGVDISSEVLGKVLEVSRPWGFFLASWSPLRTVLSAQEAQSSWWVTGLELDQILATSAFVLSSQHPRLPGRWDSLQETTWGASRRSGVIRSFWRKVPLPLLPPSCLKIPSRTWARRFANLF